MGRHRWGARRWGVAVLAGTLALGGAATLGQGVAEAATPTVEGASFFPGNGGAAGTSTWTVNWTPKTTIVAADPAITVAFPAGITPSAGTTTVSSTQLAGDNCDIVAVTFTGSTLALQLANNGALTCSVPTTSSVTLDITNVTATAGTYTTGFSITDAADAGSYVYEPGPVYVVSQTATPTVTPTAVVPTSTVGSATNVQGAALSLTVTGATLGSDKLLLNLPCEVAPSSVSFASATASSSVTGALDATAQSTGACGASVDNQLYVSPSPYNGTQTITITPTYDLNGAASGTVTLSGLYVTATASSPFVTSDLTVSNVSVTPTTPVAAIAPGTGDVAVGNLTITMPTTTTPPAGDAVCVTLVPTTGSPTTSGDVPVFDTISGPTPSSSIGVAQINGSATGATFVAGTSTETTTASTANGTPTPPTTSLAIGFSVASLGTGNPPVYVLSNVHVDVPSNELPGTVTVDVGYATTVAGCNSPTFITYGLSAFVVGTAPSGAIYGQSAVATAAAEFEAAFVSTSPTISCSNNGAAILATAADPYDALSASYLEGQLHTGVLTNLPSAAGTIDPSVLAALKEAGVSRIYVVGGPLAVTPAEIAALQGTTAYACGGLAPSGGNLSVIQAATTGNTPDQTAALIDSYVTGNGAGGLNGANNLPSLSSAFASASTYDQTTGNASAAAPATVSGTAIVASNTDWQDADAISAVAYAYHLPVVLTSATALTATAESELVKLGYDQVIVVGGQLAVTPAVVSAIQAIDVTAGGVSTPISVLRIAGPDASGTSADIAMLEAKVLGWHQTNLYVAQGTMQGSV